VAIDAASSAAPVVASRPSTASPLAPGAGLDWQILRNGPLPLETATPEASPAELAEAATQFEAYFLNVLLREMRKTVESDSVFSGDAGSRPGGYQALLDDALARHAARAGGIGLADQLTRQWETWR